MTNDGLNYASLILFGKKEKISSLFPCSEIIFEWRQDSKKISHDYRISWREPFFKIYNDVWNTINARNIRYPFQEGFFQREIFAFNEKSIREALLNAVAHRDYSISGRSIIIKASPEEFCIESPGGFPPGINYQNILTKTYWRNRAIAETFEKAGLVERSGQGIDDIFANSINEGKGMPDFNGSDEYSVCLHIPAQVKDKNFIIFLEKVTREKQITLSFEEIFELEQIRQQKIITQLESKDKFLELGLIEKVGRTKGAKYILSHQYYTYSGKAGVHTRLTGISREQKKELILNHIHRNGKGYIRDLIDALNIERKDVNNLLVELKKVGKIDFVGSKKSGHWILKDIN